MIGYRFKTTGATCLAVAPSSSYRDDYFVLNKYGDEYIVGHVAVWAMPTPDEWWGGHYFPERLGGLEAAVDCFREKAGLTNDRRVTIAQVREAEKRHITEREGSDEHR